MDKAERNALWVAVAGHAVLFGALSLNLIHATRKLPPVEEAIPVEITDVALQSAAREQLAAPERADSPETPPPEPETAEAAEAAPPEPVSKTPPPEPAPEKPKPQPKQKPAETLAKKAPAPQAAKPRLDKNWLANVIGKSKPDAAPAQLDGAAAASLGQALRSQIKPCWEPPTGSPAIDELRVLVEVNFAKDGSVRGVPRVVGREGVNADNRAYLAPFETAALRAVSRCAPISLPPELYEHWKNVELSFDRRLRN